MSSALLKFKDKIEPLYKTIDDNIKKIEDMIILLKGIQVKVASVNLYGDCLDLFNLRGNKALVEDKNPVHKDLGYFLMRTAEVVSLVEHTRSKPLILLGEFAMRRDDLESDLKSMKIQVQKMAKLRSSYDALHTRIHQMMAKKLVNLVMLSIKKRERKLLKIELFSCAQSLQNNSKEILHRYTRDLSGKIVDAITCYYGNFQQGFQILSDVLPELNSLSTPESSPREQDIGADEGVSNTSASNRDADSLNSSGIIGGLIETEREYVADIATLIQVYKTPMEQDERLFAKILKEDMIRMFSCTNDLLEFHKNFLDDLENRVCSGGSLNIAELFRRQETDLAAMYSQYVRNYPQAMRTLIKCKKSKTFSLFLRDCESQWEAGNPNKIEDLRAFLELPLTRISYYVDFYDDHDKYSGVSNENGRGEVGNTTPPNRSRAQVSANDVAEWDVLKKLRDISNFAKKVKNECQLVRLEQYVENFEGCSLEGKTFVHDGTLRVSSKFISPQSGCNPMKVQHYKCILFSDLLVVVLKKSSSSKCSIAAKFDLKKVDCVKCIDDKEGGKFSFGLVMKDDGNIQELQHTFFVRDAPSRNQWVTKLIKVLDQLETPKVFGVSLECLMQPRGGEITQQVGGGANTRVVPYFIDTLVRFLSKTENYPAILNFYRGSKTDLFNTRSLIDGGGEVDFSIVTATTVASLLLLWIARLPEPLLTYKASEEIIGIWSHPSREEKSEDTASAIRNVLGNLCAYNKFTLQCIFELLKKVSDSVKNSVSQLGSIFGPIIIVKVQGGASGFSAFTASNIATYMIEKYDVLFEAVDQERKLLNLTQKLQIDSTITIKPTTYTKLARLSSVRDLMHLRDFGKGNRRQTLPPNVLARVASVDSVSSASSSHSAGAIEQTKSSGRTTLTIPLGEIVRQGNLLKKSQRNNKWITRWFVLKYGYLYYFKSAKDKKPRGIIQLDAPTNSAVVVEASPSSSPERKPHILKVTSTVATYYLAACTEAEQQLWINDISFCCSAPLSPSSSSPSSPHSSIELHSVSSLSKPPIL